MIRESIAKRTRENKILTKLLIAQCNQHINLKEKAMIMASQTRKFQGWVGTLTYAEGAKEARQVMRGLVEDLQQNEL